MPKAGRQSTSFFNRSKMQVKKSGCHVAKYPASKEDEQLCNPNGTDTTKSAFGADNVDVIGNQMNLEDEIFENIDSMYQADNEETKKWMKRV